MEIGRKESTKKWERRAFGGNHLERGRIKKMRLFKYLLNLMRKAQPGQEKDGTSTKKKKGVPILGTT